MPFAIDLPRIALYLGSAALVTLLVISSYTDWKYRKIYNKVTLPAILIGLGLAAMTNFPAGLQSAALACVLGFSFFYLLFMLGMMGGGDVKLVAAIGALTGYPFIVDALFFGIIAGGVYAILILAIKGGLWKNIKNALWFIWGLMLWRKAIPLQTTDSIKIPYGLCLSAGTMIALLLRHVMQISQGSLVLGY